MDEGSAGKEAAMRLEKDMKRQLSAKVNKTQRLKITSN